MNFIVTLFQNNYVCFISGIIVGINLYIIALRNKYVKLYMYQRNHSDLMYKINKFYFSSVLISTWLANSIRLLKEHSLCDEREPTDEVEILKKALDEVEKEFEKLNYMDNPPNNNNNLKF